MEGNIQIDLPIIPDKSLGGFELRDHLIDIQNLVANLGGTLPNHYKLIAPFEARYSVGDGVIQIGVDVRNGKISWLGAYTGYKGLLLDKISIGMKVKDIFQFIPDIYYDEPTETLLSKKYPGLGINVAELDPPQELIPEMDIISISISASESITYKGTKGLW